MSKLAGLLAVLLVAPVIALAEPATARLEPALVKAVVRILAKGKRTFTGTGFIVSHAPEDRSQDRNFYIVTNKHVISDWNVFDGDASENYETLEVTLPGEAGASHTFTLKIADTSGALDKSLVRLHKSAIVDLAAIAVTRDQLSPSAAAPASIETSSLVKFEQSDRLLGLGDQVFAIGYPRAIVSMTSAHAAAKAGYLSTQPGHPLAVDIRGETRARRVISRRLGGTIFLVDGLVLPGNSGAPVLLTSDVRLRKNPTTNAVEVRQMKPGVIGIVSSGIEGTGLAIVYSADYILELIEEFSQQRRTTAK